MALRSIPACVRQLYVAQSTYPHPVQHWRRALRVAFLVLALVLLTVTLINQWNPLRQAAARLDVMPVVASAILAALGLGAQMLSWRSLLEGTGETPPLAAAARIYFVGQLGKYIPGSVWAVVAQAELGRDHLISRSRSAMVALSSLGVLVVLGGSVGVAGLAAGSPGSVATYWWALLAVPVCAAVLAPPVFNRLVGWALRAMRSSSAPVPLGGRALAASSAWALVMWLAFGAHAWVLAAAVGATPDLRSAAVTTGAFALAWVVGLVVVVAPAGAGAREAALVIALAPVLGRTDALALALVSRLLMIVGDLAWAAAAGLRRSTRREPRSAVGTNGGPAL